TSSPAAAIQALETKASGISAAAGEVTVTDDVAAIDEQGERSVLDLDLDDVAEIDDVVPGADASDVQPSDRERRRLRELIKQAVTLQGSKDPKLIAASEIVGELLEDGFRPIIFCRYIATAEYVAEHLADQLRRRFPEVKVAA